MSLIIISLYLVRSEYAQRLGYILFIYMSCSVNTFIFQSINIRLNSYKDITCIKLLPNMTLLKANEDQASVRGHIPLFTFARLLTNKKISDT